MKPYHFPPLKHGKWWGNAMRRDDNGATGFELPDCVEAGAPEELIDHPGQINYVAIIVARRASM